MGVWGEMLIFVFSIFIYSGMSRRKKHKKQSEVRTLNNVFHNKIEDIKGNIKGYFANENPIVLELGCGNGEYTNSLALKYVDKN